MATCPSGHESVSDDFCDVCGVLITAARSLAPTPTGGPAGSGATGGGAALSLGEPCPRCGVPRGGQFCESCGYDFTVVGQETLGPDMHAPAPPLPAPAPPAPPAPWSAPWAPQSAPVKSGPAAAEWTAVVTADRSYFDAIQAAGGADAAGIAFPAYFPQRRFRLAGTEVRIGRRSHSSGIDPEIDLSVPPADPGVSRLHAVLLKAPDGTWSVVDPGSANGTAVNGSEIPHGQAVPLRDGDRIHLGAWTELRVVRGS